ncbi:S-adenosyl-L-methionine-dependent methyltransferase [Rhexocercosporidium sp. MPI-PUGE-AT-0058]|nr:S-adenosyl-L-methionine-dependent methyltransferase [Rhexocercosporidium sp. MPI-PUGE-AT-0058]
MATLDQTQYEDVGPQPVILDVDSQPSDSDSAIGTSLKSDTSSIRSSLYEHIEENGRTYHKYKPGQYYLPNDEMEQSRLDLQHILFNLTFDGKLALAPISNPQMVMDIGTGTGLWAIDFASENPAAIVIGTDLSAIQPAMIPPNVRFEISDAEDEWTYTQKFDYIHGRALTICFKEPLKVFKSAYDNLAPGGYFEMQDLYFRPHSDDGTLTGTALEKWNAKLAAGGAKMGKDWWCTPNYARWFQEAGFEAVVEKKFFWPGNTWPKGKKQKEMGMTMLANSMEGVEAISLKMFTGLYGMGIEEVNEVVRDVKKDLCDKNIHAYYPLYVVYGRKPLDAPAW